MLLSDVAEVRESTLTPRKRFVYSNQPAVGLEVRFRKGEDASAVGVAVRRAAQEVGATLPPGMRVVVCHDQPEWIAHSVRSFIESLLEGMALVMLIITLGMGWRAALVVSGRHPPGRGRRRAGALPVRLQPRDREHRRADRGARACSSTTRSS